MAKPRPGKPAPKPNELHVLPMELRVGDRLSDATGEWELVARVYMTNGGKTAHARVQRPGGAGDPNATQVRTWGAQECPIASSRL